MQAAGITCIDLWDEMHPQAADLGCLFKIATLSGIKGIPAWEVGITQATSLS